MEAVIAFAALIFSIVSFIYSFRVQEKQRLEDRRISKIEQDQVSHQRLLSTLQGEKEEVADTAAAFLRLGFPSDPEQRAEAVRSLILAAIFERSNRARTLVYAAIFAANKEKPGFIEAELNNLERYVRPLKVFTFSPDELNIAKFDTKVTILKKLVSLK